MANLNEMSEKLRAMFERKHGVTQPKTIPQSAPQQPVVEDTTVGGDATFDFSDRSEE